MSYSLQICHEKRFNFHREILPELRKIVGDKFFIPIAYRASITNDYFFVNNQGEALIKLFENNLRVGVRDSYVDLVVKFCVAKFKGKMLCPHQKLAMIVSTSVDTTRTSNLSLLSSHQQLSDVEFSLSLSGCFQALCEQIIIAQSIMLNVQTLNLSNNGISTLKPLSKLTSLKFYALDLRFNKISSIEEFEFLRNFRLQVIFLEGNPISNLPLFNEKLKAILPTLKKVDDFYLNEESFRHNQSQTLKFDNRSDEIFIFSQSLVFRAGQLTDSCKQDFHTLANHSWNKVVVEHNGRVEKKTILEELNNQLFNRTQFYPCYYREGKKKDFFFLRKNFSALNLLIMKDLTVRLSHIDYEIKFQIHLKCAEWVDGQIDWQNKLNYVIQKRIVGSTLSLDNFASDSCLSDLFVSLATVQGLSFIITTAQKINNKIISISFRNNIISNIEGLKFLKHFPKLISIDLSGNRIESFEGLPELSSIVELFLDKNPICLRYYDEPWRYVGEILKAFPRLRYIDGHRIDKHFQTVPFQNFFVTPNVYTLSENFIKFFFELYDSTCRSSLIKLYEAESLFTLSSELVDVASRNSRNNLKRMESKVCNGRAHINEFFDYLPQTQHDFVTMSVDVPFVTDESILIHVNGYFKEIGQTLNDVDEVYSFARTFLLKRKHRKSGATKDTFEYVVLNEQLHIRGIDSIEDTQAFKKDAVTEDEIDSICKELLPLKSQKEHANILVFNKMTNLKISWCKR